MDHTQNQKQNHKRKIGIAVLAGLAITGIIGASAASLGGIDSDSLGADVGVVAACDEDGVTAAYDIGFDGDSGETEVDQVTIGDVAAACNGLSYEVTLLDGAGAALATREGTTPLLNLTGEFTVDFQETILEGNGVSANAVEGISVAIYGALLP